jgi:hypothetical protein
MRLISHRGNINGPNPVRENSPYYIMEALTEGYDVEIDVWLINGELFLGHDEPQYKIDATWLIDRASKLWVHCKNIDALIYLKKCEQNINYFWHQEDDVTITSLGFFWTYPGKQLTNNSIAVMPEIKNFNDIDISYGICSDVIKKYKNDNN